MAARSAREAGSYEWIIFVVLCIGFLRRRARAGQGGAVLGVFPAWTYQDSSVDLSSGDRLLLFTEGITEAEGPDGEEFGTEKVAAFAKAQAAKSVTACGVNGVVRRAISG